MGGHPVFTKCVGQSSERAEEIARAAWLLAALTLTCASACGGGDDTAATGMEPAQHRSAVRDLEVRMRTAQQEIRPTTDEPYLGIGYEGEEAFSYVSPGDHFRVWWVESGAHKVPLADAEPANGVPDYVELVAAQADEVVADLELRGYRPTIDDDTIPVSWEVGGDGRFDIYLVDFARSSDGLVARNGCRTQLGSTVCTTHMLIENDFAGYGYPSIEEAIRVLTSHEYFHAVQAAYTDELAQWVSEGTATWFEESFDPSQSDFERLANGYFESPERSLNSRSQGPFDGFAYSTALFFYHLELRYDAELMRLLFERIALGSEALSAIDAILQAEYDSSLVEAYESFAAWNAFTGSRAITGEGYAVSHLFDEVPVASFNATRGINWDASVASVAAKYAAFEVDGPVKVGLEALPDRAFAEQTRALVMRGPDDFDVVAAGEEPVVLLEPGALVFVALLNASSEDDTSARVTFRKYTPPAPMEPEEPADMGMEPDGSTDMGMESSDMPEDMSPVVILPEPEPEPETEETCTSAPFGAPSAPRDALLFVLLAGVFGKLRRHRRRGINLS